MLGHDPAYGTSFQSVSFNIVKLKVYNPFKVDVADIYPEYDQATLGNILRLASDVLIKKDAPDDYRAAVRFVIGDITLYQENYFRNFEWNTDTDPTPVYGHQQRTINDGVDFIIMERLTSNDEENGLKDVKGATILASGTILVEKDASDQRFATNIAHELGHRLGLGHTGHEAGFLMHGEGAGNKLKKSDADAFLAGNV